MPRLVGEAKQGCLGARVQLSLSLAATSDWGWHPASGRQTCLGQRRHQGRPVLLAVARFTWALGLTMLLVVARFPWAW